MAIGLPALLSFLLMAVGFAALPLAVSFGTQLELGTENLPRILALYVLFMAVLAFFGNMGAGFIMSRHLHRIMRKVDEAMPSGDQNLPAIKATDEIEALGIVIDEATTTLNQLVKDSHILQNLPEAVITLDSQGRVTHLNTSASRLLAAHTQDLLGKPLTDLIVPSRTNQPLLSSVDRALLGESIPLELMEFQVGEGEKHAYWVSIHPINIWDSSTGSRRISICIRDRDSINAVRDQIRKIERLAAVGKVAASMAHEVRNPLGSIRTFTELLGEDIHPEDPKATYTREMLYQIDRLNQLMEEILAFSRDPVMSIKDVDLQELMSRTILHARHRLKETRVTIEEHYEPGLPLLRGDPEKLFQAFLNLCINAMEACHSSGTVAVHVEWEAHEPKEEETLCVHITDTGAGIPEDNLKKLFDPFFTTKPNGTGLGLSIAHNIIAAHGGRIHVSSEEGKGSHFQIFLPRKHHFCSVEEENPWRAGRHA